MTNNHKSMVNNDVDDDHTNNNDLNNNVHHECANMTDNDRNNSYRLSIGENRSTKIKLQSKLSADIDDNSDHDNDSDNDGRKSSPIMRTSVQKTIDICERQRPRTTTGIKGENYCYSKSSILSNNNTNLNDEGKPKNKDQSSINNFDDASVSDLESLESLNLNEHSYDNRNVNLIKHASYSSPTSPKMMISTCNDQGLSNKSIVRVIKPTAIHPNIHYYHPPRPSTSVDVHHTNSSIGSTSSSFMASASTPSSSSSSAAAAAASRLRHNSAFHQVLSSHHHQNQSIDSNSFSEPSSLVFASNPYSNPISMENIENDGTEEDNNTFENVDDKHHQQQQQQEPIHMTLEEVRRIAFGSPERRQIIKRRQSNDELNNDSSSNNNTKFENSSSTHTTNTISGLQNARTKIKNFMDTLLYKTTPCISGNDSNDNCSSNDNSNEVENMVKCSNHNRQKHVRTSSEIDARFCHEHPKSMISSPFSRRALPSVPSTVADHNNNIVNDDDDRTLTTNNIANNNNDLQSIRYRNRSSLQCPVSRSQLKSMSESERQKYLDYVSSIERVKNCGWYWGPISGEMAEKLLESEPCGSFLVRDSSDEHYIFSLSFKLDEMVRHVRIEQEQGNFSFGSLKKFRSSTIVDFIESAMQHSRSGQFLFFLRLGPELGPIRVQLLYPVSRFKRVQSLQHICRFVILQFVRRDQIHQLPLPEYLRQYLDTPYYYSEELAKMQQQQQLQQQQSTILTNNGDENSLSAMKRRLLFLQTDYKTLISKMLINRCNIERNLSIQLPRIDSLNLDDDLPPSSSSSSSTSANDTEQTNADNDRRAQSGN